MLEKEEFVGEDDEVAVLMGHDVACVVGELPACEHAYRYSRRSAPLMHWLPD